MHFQSLKIRARLLALVGGPCLALVAVGGLCLPVLAEAQDYRTEQTLVIALVTAGLLFGLLLGFQMARTLSHALQQATVLANALAVGRLDASAVVPEPTAPHEIGQLLQALAQLQATLTRFQTEQAEMAQQQALGVLAHRIPTHDMPGCFGAMAHEINHMVHANTALTMQVVNAATGYAEGRLTNSMERLPGQKARISDTLERLRLKLLAADKNLHRLSNSANTQTAGLVNVASSLEVLSMCLPPLTRPEAVQEVVKSIQRIGGVVHQLAEESQRHALACHALTASGAGFSTDIERWLNPKGFTAPPAINSAQAAIKNIATTEGSPCAAFS